MVKVIKLGNSVYQNIEPKTIDKNGNEIWNIPNDPTKLKAALVDTLGWLVSQNIVKLLGSADKKDASISKAVMLLAKVVSTLNPDTTKLTANEQTAFQAMVDIANTGYSDSTTLNDSFNILKQQLQWYAQKMQELETASTLDELVAFAENIES